MRKIIVITSIFQPTEAIKSFAKLNNYELIVVGDKKSPKNWSEKNTCYLSIIDQEKQGFSLVEKLPFNHYSRKMIGYLKAFEKNAECIIDTDDDNIPKQNWSFPNFEGEFDCLDESLGFVNIYELFTEQKIWPRGLPLSLINKKFDLESQLTVRECQVGIWQGLADEDPDVDAIYRLVSDKPCYFDKRKPVVLGRGTIAPFNTQNTLIRKELFPLLYLPTYVTFRFTDILRGLIAQPIMWLYNYHLGFIDATVIQKRNPHDYMKDFVSEIPMYKRSEDIIDIVSNRICKTNTISDNLLLAYEALAKESIVSEEEIKTLEIWLKDISRIVK